MKRWKNPEAQRKRMERMFSDGDTADEKLNEECEPERLDLRGQLQVAQTLLEILYKGLIVLGIIYAAMFRFIGHVS